MGNGILGHRVLRREDPVLLGNTLTADFADYHVAGCGTRLDQAVQMRRLRLSGE